MDPLHEAPQPLPPLKRPLFLGMLCIFAGVYFFLLAVLFLSGFFYSGWVSDAINMYADADRYSPAGIKTVLGVLAALFILGFTGIVVMWRMKRYGYYFFGISSIILASFQLFRPEISVSGTIIFIALLILFGLYFRRFR